MRSILFDSDVLLDVLMRRPSFLAASAAALEAAVGGETVAYVSAHAVTTMSYMLRRQIGSNQTRVLLADLLSRLQVAPVGDNTIREALFSPVSDFEDAVCDAAAAGVGAEVIVTRNVADFARGRVPALLPEDLLVRLAP